MNEQKKNTILPPPPVFDIPTSGSEFCLKCEFRLRYFVWKKLDITRHWQHDDRFSRTQYYGWTKRTDSNILGTAVQCWHDRKRLLKEDTCLESRCDKYSLTLQTPNLSLWGPGHAQQLWKFSSANQCLAWQSSSCYATSRRFSNSDTQKPMSCTKICLHPLRNNVTQNTFQSEKMPITTNSNWV